MSKVLGLTWTERTLEAPVQSLNSDDLDSSGTTLKHGGLHDGCEVLCVLPKEGGTFDLDKFEPRIAAGVLHCTDATFNSNLPARSPPGLIFLVQFTDGQCHKSCGNFNGGDNFTSVRNTWSCSGPKLRDVCMVMYEKILIGMDILHRRRFWLHSDKLASKQIVVYGGVGDLDYGNISAAPAKIKAGNKAKPSVLSHKMGTMAPSVFLATQMGPEKVGIGLSHCPKPDELLTAKQCSNAKSRGRAVHDDDGKLIKDELDKMEHVCKQIHSEHGHKWLQLNHTEEPGHFAVLYHKPYLQMVAELASREGALDEECATLSQDLTFGVGKYYVHMMCYKEIRLKDKPLLPFRVTILKAYETDDFHDKRLEHTIKEVPDFQDVRFMGGDLQKGQRKSAKKHLRKAHTGACETHVFREGGVIDRACNDKHATNAEFYKKVSRPETSESSCLTL